MDYVIPEFEKEAFNCPYSNGCSRMQWESLCKPSGNRINSSNLSLASCDYCYKESYWYTENDYSIMVFPISSSAPIPHPDLPDDCKQDYQEARLIVGYSPRGAGALLRLVIQKLCERFSYRVNLLTKISKEWLTMDCLFVCNRHLM